MSTAHKEPHKDTNPTCAANPKGSETTAPESASEHADVDILITSATLITPEGHIQGDIAISQGRIVDAKKAKDAGLIGDSTICIEADGCYVLTGLVDLNMRVGEPDNPAESIESGALAAVCGGFSTVVAIADQYPPEQIASRKSAADITYLRNSAAHAKTKVLVAAALTHKGELAPMAELSRAGAALFTDGAMGLEDPLLMRRVLQYAKSNNVTVATQCQSRSLVNGAVIAEGRYSTQLGLEGNPAASEHTRLCRDLILAELTQTKLHIQTISSAESVQLIKEHRKRHPEAQVSVEVAAHQLLLEHSACKNFDPNTLVNPPLRSERDRQALVEAVNAGDIDAIVSAHTPLPNEAKDRPYQMCVPGTIGVQTAMSTALSAGVEIDSIARSMSWKPAEIAGLGTTETRNLNPGAIADITVIDPNTSWIVDVNELQSQARNSIVAGKELKGQIRACIVAGELRALNGKPFTR